MEKFVLNGCSSVSIDFEKGVISQILRGNKQLNYGNAPLFTIKMRDKQGNGRFVESTSCKFLRFEKGVAYYESKYFNAQINLRVDGGALVMRANVQNKTEDLLESVELSSFSVLDKLKDEEGGTGEIVYPYNEGCIVSDMSFRERMPFKYVEPEYPSKGSYSIFPNMVFAQFIAYLNGESGIYLGMHDAERTTKHVNFCYYNGGIKVFMSAFCDVNYGEDYVMPFDCVLKVFDGSWHNAVDIYYDWFSKNLPEGLTKISQNSQLPSWYGQSPLVVAYPIRGKVDTDTSPNGLYPYKNAFPHLEEIALKSGSKVMALLMHWEGTAPWAPPYAWPPYGGEDEFKNFVDEAHDKGFLVGLYSSGFGWTNQSNIIKSYNKQSDFESLRVANAVCTNSDGTAESVICTAQRNGLDLCPAHPTTKAIFKEEFSKICSSGIDYFQALDQNHGGNSYFCYSDNHGHVPAPGKWQQKAVNEILSSIDKNGVVFGCESSSAEPFLSRLQFSDNRYELNYYVGMPTPIYAYLYHEYVNNFMGNQICNILSKTSNDFTYRLAYSFIAGDTSTVVLNGDGEILHAWCDCVEPKEVHVDKEVAFKFIKTLNAWRSLGGKEFLHLGKMIKPIEIKTSRQRIKLADDEKCIHPDSVLTSAFEFGGKKAQFLVNYNLIPVEVELAKFCDVYFDENLRGCKKSVNKLIIEPLSVVMIEI